MLKEGVDSYLALRRGVGFILEGEGRMLHSFARFALGRGETRVRASTAVAWAALAPSPRQRERRLRVVAAFVRHVRAEDLRHEEPPVDVFGHHRSRRLPHVYSEGEIRRLLEAAARLGPPGSFRPHVYVTLFGLMAATGLRVSEALKLAFEDVTPDGLVIRETKFHKSRLVPLHESAATALERYLSRRRRAGGSSRDVFISTRGTRLTYAMAIYTFLQLARKVGLRAASGGGPRLHDIRHTFAVRALESSPGGGTPVARHVRALSTYLGHANFAQTYWYLQATPRLMRRVADACEALLEGGSP